MANIDIFKEKFRQLGALVDSLDSAACSDDSCRELIRLLMEVHGAALERMMEIVDESGTHGGAIISKVGDDPFVRPLLLLYSLHPECLETRVSKALDEARQRLRKFNREVELLDLCDGAVRVRTRATGHACGSTADTVHSIVEERLYEFAPDLNSLEILEPEEQVASGFVSVDSLLQHPISARPVAIGMQTTGAD